MSHSPSTARAVALATALAASYDVTVREPEVLANGANVIVHLHPAPVVARVAHVTAAVRTSPVDFLARDLAVASYAYGRGAAVVPPATELPAGPHTPDGLAVTYWRFVAHERREPDAGDMGARLRDLHRALEGFAGDLPYLSPAFADARDVLDNLETRRVLSAADADAFRARIVECERALPDDATVGQALHGDAHSRNTLATAGGIVWTDFEDSCRGSVAWDLACIGRRLGPAAIAGYGDPRPSDAEIAAHTEARLVQGAIWERIFAARDAGTLLHGLDEPVV